MEGMHRSPTSLLDTVGDTPLVELKRLSPRPGIRLFAKLEGANPSGSVKDRISRAIVDAAEARGDLQPGATLVEASTGNTAIALAMVARRRGYELKVVIPEGVVPSIADILDVYGVEIIWTKPKAGMYGAICHARDLAKKHGWFAVGQFEDPLNVRTHFETTGTEIVRQLPSVDVFVAGIGTGGTITGVGRRLREHNPEVRIVGIEPKMGECLQGLRSLDEGYRPPLFDIELLNGRYLVSSDQALRTMRHIVRTEGILAGVSCGATLHAALRYADKLDRADIVVMFSDGGWKYLPARPWTAAAEGDERLDETHWW